MIKREEALYCLYSFVTAAAVIALWLLTGFSAYWVLPVFMLQIVIGFAGIWKVYKKASVTEQLLSAMREDHTGWRPDKKEEALFLKDSIFARQLEEMKEIGRILADKEDKREADMKWLKDLMSDITHQMKTPLAALEVYIDIFKKEMSKHMPESEELSERARQSMEKIRWLVTGLLKIAQLESGSYVMEREPAPLKDTIEKSVHALQPILDARELKVRISTHGNGEVKLDQDKDWLQEAFQNIIKNAAEYADEESTIDIDINATPMAVVVTVTDQGEGIEPSELPKIFNRFYRARRASGERGNGVGIGLALAKQIIEAHDGVITAKSKTGEGSYTSIVSSFLLQMGGNKDELS